MDKQGSAHRTTPDNGVIYKSGYFTATVQNFNSLIPNFTDPLTPRSPNSSDTSFGCRLHCSRDEGSLEHHMVTWASQTFERKKKLALQLQICGCTTMGAAKAVLKVIAKTANKFDEQMKYTNTKNK